MKQGDKYMKVVMLVLAVMVASYLLYSLLSAGSGGAKTAQAVLYSTTDGVNVQGFVVREESVIPADYDLVLSTKPEGAKVASGEEVALSLRSNEAWQRQEQIQALETQLAQLQEALDLQTQLTDSQSVTQAIGQSAAAYASRIAGGDLQAADAEGRDLKALVLRQVVGDESQSAIAHQISTLKTELASLKASANRDTVSIIAQSAGYYSAAADGYETVLTPDILSTVTVERFRELWESGGAPVAPGTNAGRLIHSSQWYYAVLAEPEVLEHMEEGDRLSVHLSDGSRELEMTVLRISRGEEQGLLVLTCREGMSEISSLRRLDASVIFHSYTGLRVPKEAVCYDEEAGSAGVYVLVNGKAKWKNVELLYDMGDAYVANLDQSTTDNLWPQDLILLETENLYDGKVVD